MYVGMCICVYVYRYRCICLLKYMLVHVYVNSYVCLYVWLNIYIWIYREESQFFIIRWTYDLKLFFYKNSNISFVVQLLSSVQLFATSWTVALHASLSFISWSLLKLMPFNHLVLCHPLILLPSIFPSIRVFSNKLDPRISWPKYWSFSFSISTSNKYSGLISFRIDWFNLLVVQWTLKSLLQHHSLKAWILQCSAFSVVHLSHLYMTAGKTVALTIRTFVGKVISLIFNTLPKFVIAFVQGIFYFHDCSDVGAQENKVCHCFHCFPFYLPGSDGNRCHDLRFLNAEF